MRPFRSVVYLPDAFPIEEGGSEWMRHQNRGQCKLMARVLGEMAYVISKHKRRFRPSRDYNPVVSERRDWSGVDGMPPEGAVNPTWPPHRSTASTTALSNGTTPGSRSGGPGRTSCCDA